MQRSQYSTSSLLLQLIALSNIVIFIAALRTAIPLSTPIRCSSRDAAELIQNRTANDNDGGLLVITCDASGRGGGSKHDGVASVLRIRHGVALLHRQQLTSITDGSSSSLVATTTTAAASVDNVSSQQSTTSSGSNDEKEDLIQTISRRTIPSRTSSEVAAIAFGIKHAIKTVPSSLRNKVLILSDSEFALDFYCGEKSYGNRQQQPNTTVRRRTSSISNKRRGKRQPATRSIEIREESYWRLFATLLKETSPGGVILSKIKSSSRSVGLNTSRTSSVNNGDDTSSTEGDDSTSSWDGKGFLDHDASDYLSSNARYISNNSDNEDDNNFPFRAVSRLTPDDLNWLAHSENDTVGVNGGKLLNDDIWNEVIVKGSDAREDRRRRKERRIDSIQGLLN
ncbi:hypothetical protein QTG54_015492 [Skeletonema marinoi]|uniref:Uncharacterized protein n=1 Tax=Skeletonema marinoi TaxID=267567 RepID=A0AAD8XUT0_9STRA|nr:hypothetical protein QTG54_015492 [Skeletonema marinoi]